MGRDQFQQIDHLSYFMRGQNTFSFKPFQRLVINWLWLLYVATTNDNGNAKVDCDGVVKESNDVWMVSYPPSSSGYQLIKQ